MAYDVIKKAASIYKGVDMASLVEEEIVCECARVSLRTIQDVIRINDLKTVEEITQYTKAGAFCKSCIRPGGHEKRSHYLVDILRDDPRRNGARKKWSPRPRRRRFRDHEPDPETPGRSKRPWTKRSAPALAADGGSMEIVDIREAEGMITIYIRYLGACQGCISSTKGTLQFIENVLHKELSQNIRVLPV